MELDFTGLQAITAGAAFKEEPAEGQKTGNPALQRQADQNRHALQAAAEVYKTYQQNIAATEQLQAEILKGIRNQQNIYTLFLTAVKALSLTVNNRELYQQAAQELPRYYPEAPGQ